MKVEASNEIILQNKFSQVNPNPVLSSGIDGTLLFVNPATSKLKHQLALEQIVDLLPANHKGLVNTCLKSRVALTEESMPAERNITWTYMPGDEYGVVYIYGFDVTLYRSESSRAKGLPEANPNPVLTYSIEGKLQFKNRAVSILLHDLRLENIKDILPANHERLVRSCLKTRAPVAGDRQVCNQNIVWSYRLSDDCGAVHIYGHDVTNRHPENSSCHSLPEMNPNPVVTSGPDGRTQYANNAVLLLLLDLELENTEDLLPQNHKGMVKACHSTSTSLTVQHHVAEKTFIWSYHPVGDSEVIYIYGYDITNYKMNAHSEPVQ